MRPSFLEEMSWAMGEVYAEVVDRILINLAHYFPYIQDGAEPKGSFEYQARMLAQMGKVNQETIGIIKGSLQGADAALKDGLEAAIRDALKNEEPKLRQAAERGMLKGEGFLPPEVDPSQMQAFKSYYRQSADKLNLVNTVMLESTQQAYRATVSDIVNRVETTQRILNTATGEVVTGVSTWNQAMRGAVDRMVENGLTGFVDHAGHHWRPETYAVMDIRSTMFNTARAAVWERNEQYGNDLYQVSSHNGARPLCYPWQGKIISRADRSGTVEDLDGNKIEIIPQSQTSYGQAAGLFGVNCKHYPMTFIPGVSTLRGQPQDPEENEKTYAESQEQRRLERKLREKRLKVEQLKAQGAPEEEIRAAKAKAKEASDRVQEFCDETGRARRRNREGTPVIASWKGAEKGPFAYGANSSMPELQRGISEQQYPFLPSSKNTINNSLIDSPEYTERFVGITGNPEADSKIAETAKKILQHRTGTDYEDLALIDADTGELIHLLSTSNVRHGVSYDAGINAAIEDAHKGNRRIISVHNHPNNYPPSFDDGVSAKAHGYVQGVVVCHDGSIYTFTPADATYSEEECDALHDMIDEEVYQTMDLKNTWFTTMRIFGMIVTERK